MKIDIKKTMLSVGSVLGFLALFGISGGFLTGNIQGMWKAPAEIEILKEKVAFLEEENKHLEHFKESMWEFAKDMTDNEDLVNWMIGHHGREYPVDVRNNNENTEFGFVDYMYMIYKLNYDRDSIKHLMLHDPDEFGKNRVDLYEGD